MINQAAQANYRFRWLHAALWGLYALVYFSWLLAPMMPDWFRYPGAWWFPDVYVNYAFEGMTGSTADWELLPVPVLRRISNRIINEVKGINRVCLDISSKPPATIEWE